MNKFIKLLDNNMIFMLTYFEIFDFNPVMKKTLILGQFKSTETNTIKIFKFRHHNFSYNFQTFSF